MFIFLTVSSFSYSSPCEDAMASSKRLPTQNKQGNLLEQSLKNPDIGTRVKAIYLIGGIGGGSSLSLLESALKDQSVYVRFKVTEELLRKKGLTLPLQLKILSVLRQILENRSQLEQLLKESKLDDVESLSADGVLEKIHEARSFLQSKILFALEKNIKSSDMKARLEAIEAAGAIGEPARPFIQLKDFSLSEKLHFWKAQFQTRMWMYGVVENPL